MKKSRLIGGLLLLCFLPFLSYAQEDQEIAPVTRTFVLKNATIVPQPGQTIEKGQILIKNGLIEAIGETVSAPVNAKVIDVDSMYIYPGFIEGLSHTGVPRPKDNGERPRIQDPGNPPNDAAGIQPERSVIELLKADESSVESMRKLGFTAAHVVPYGNMLPGQGAIILLSGDSPEDMVLAANTSMFSQLEGARRMYPSTTMAVMSKWRELYKQAMQAQAHEKNYQKNPRGLARPSYDAVLEAFYPVLEKELPVFFTAEGVKDAYRVLALQEDLGFPLVLAGLKQGFYMTEELKTKSFPLLLSLDIPEQKEDEKKEADSEEEKVSDPEKEALKKRRDEAIARHQSQAATLAKAGLEFGFSTLEVKSGDLKKNLLTMIEKGFDEEKALASLTTVPAKMLGMSEMLGTLEKGKIANLVITDKPYFEKASNVRYVFVDGTPFEYEAKKAKKKADADATTSTAAVAGEWSYTINIPGQVMSGTFKIKTEGSELSGTIVDPEDGSEGELQEVMVAGNDLSFSFPYDAGGQAMKVSFDVVIDGDEMEGKVTAGSFGTFDVEGTRIGTPE